MAAISEKRDCDDENTVVGKAYKQAICNCYSSFVSVQNIKKTITKIVGTVYATNNTETAL